MARNANFASLSREGTVSARGSLSSMTTPPPYFGFPGQLAPQNSSGLGLRRPSSVPLPDAWLGGFGSTMFPPQVPYPLSSMALPHVPLMTSRPVSPSPITGISFAAQQHQTHGLLLRRPSSAQPMGMVGRRSWTTPYDGYTVMPFLQDLGIDHQLRHLQPDAQQGEAEIAGEPDYTLFSGFSFNTSQIGNPSVVITSQDTQNVNNLGPHELAPSLNLSMEHIGWTGEMDPALDSATSMVSSSSITESSHESSPAPSDNIYAPTSDTNLYAGGQMYPIDANYDLGLTPFDISQMDTLTMSNAGFSHDLFDPTGMHVLLESPQAMDPILHAPKPMLANDCTPTKMIFGEELGPQEYVIH